MSILSENIRHLRNQEGVSQQKLADTLILTRARLAKYEEGKSEPPLDILQRIARHFHVSIDVLISVDLRKVSLKELLELGANRILLPITVDTSGNEPIEVVPFRAKAGYLSGYSDPEYIEQLQHMQLPFMPVGKHRAFPIEGDSMPPLREGSFVVGRYIEHVGEIRDGSTYVILSRNDGIVYKRIYNRLKEEGCLYLHSDNPVYPPYAIQPEDILEIWEYTCSVNTREYQPDDLNLDSIRDMFRQLRVELAEMRQAVGA
ncbi:MAG: LexA family transcriptional regulator [Flavobacteriales bacterium]|nr:LexA family transcriptional regulator [Flavobacteriales bacterium]MCB9449082.1 LexA family transcriptional regulator [Flavobacteriales bacterium]